MAYTYKELITRLQMLPEVAIPIAVEVYPEIESTYGGSRYYCTAQTQAEVNIFISHYLAVVNSWRNIAIAGRESSYLKKLSDDITKDKVTSYGKAKAIHDWVFYNISYKETSSLVPPEELAKTRAGDCKSFTVLITTLLGIQNIPCWFKLVQFSDINVRHIYNYVLTSWQPVDGTGYFCFEEVKRVIGYMLFEVDKVDTSPPRPLPSPVGAEEVPPPLEVGTFGGISPLLIGGLTLIILGGKSPSSTTNSLI